MTKTFCIGLLASALTAADSWFFGGHGIGMTIWLGSLALGGLLYGIRRRDLVIDDPKEGLLPHHHTFFVRHVWDQTRRNCIGTIDRPTLSFYRRRGFDLSYNNDGVIYGDCRDPGHILTCKYMFEEHGKSDHTIWDPNAPLAWFFEVNCLWTELCHDKQMKMEA